MRVAPRLPGLAWLQVAAAVAAVCMSLHAQPAAASATPGPAAAFVHDINVSRASAGLPALAVSSDLAAVATRWAATMGKQGALSHNPALGTDIKNWTGLAENVGMGQNEPQLHAAFMHSAPHRANILAPIYSQVGVGVVVVDHTLYVVEDFRRPA